MGVQPEIKINKEDAKKIVDDIKGDVSTYDVDAILETSKSEKSFEDLTIQQAKKEIDKWLLVGVMTGAIEYKKEDKKITLKLQQKLKGEDIEKSVIYFHVKNIDMTTMKMFEDIKSEVDQQIEVMVFLTHEHNKILKKLSGNDLYFATSITKLFL